MAAHTFILELEEEQLPKTKSPFGFSVGSVLKTIILKGEVRSPSIGYEKRVFKVTFFELPNGEIGGKFQILDIRSNDDPSVDNLLIVAEESLTKNHRQTVLSHYVPVAIESLQGYQDNWGDSYRLMVDQSTTAAIAARVDVKHRRRYFPSK